MKLKIVTCPACLGGCNEYVDWANDWAPCRTCQGDGKMTVKAYNAHQARIVSDRQAFKRKELRRKANAVLQKRPSAFAYRVISSHPKYHWNLDYITGYGEFLEAVTETKAYALYIQDKIMTEYQGDISVSVYDRNGRMVTVNDPIPVAAPAPTTASLEIPF